MIDHLSLSTGLLALGGAFTIAGTILSALETSQNQHHFAEKLEAKNEEIIELTKANAETVRQETLNSVIGGDSWVHIEPHLSGTSLILTLNFTGRYPLQDVVLWKNKQRMKWTEPNTYAFLGSENHKKEILHTLYPLMFPSILETVDLSELDKTQDGIFLEYSFFSRNGKTHNHIYVRKRGSSLTRAYKVTHEKTGYQNGKLSHEMRSLIKKVDADFPIEEIIPNGGKGPGSWSFEHFEDQN